MSNKGAVKKISATKDALKSSSKTKSKNVLSNEDSESPGKSDSRYARKPQNSEQRGDGDKTSRLTQNTQLTKSNIRQAVKTTQNKSVRDKLSPMAKSSTSSTKTVQKIIPPSRTRSDTSKKVPSNSNTARSKSTIKTQSSYSEKRGVSTIYMPQSTASKLSSKSQHRASSVSSEKEKLKARNASEGNKSGPVPRERKVSRTLSPSEVKVLHSASLHRTDPSKKNVKSDTDDEYDYEDDFEEYESDFQECTDSDTSQISEISSNSQSNVQLDPIELHSAEKRKTVGSAEHQKDEEHMHDSGHYELAEARRRAARVESIIANQSKSSPLLELRQPINKSYSNEDRPSENKSLPSSTDEGFEDSRSGDFSKSPPLSQISFIDFRKPKETQSEQKVEKVLSRGRELLEMIKLDVMEWSLLECTPIPYEEFIRSYGKLNTHQMSTQTGEDNIDVETQTEASTSKNKWTQFPVTCRNNLRNKEDLNLFQMDQIGVGSDNDAEAINSLSNPSYDSLRLSEFLNQAGRVMLSLLEERRYGGNVFKHKEQLPFSDGVIKLSVNSVTFLAGRAVTIIHYSECLNKVLLTIHSSVEEEIETTSIQDYITDCCIGCVWNISEPSMPMKLFYSQCPITACCFHLTNYNVVFAGLEDGSISLWDLKEDEMWHHRVTDKANERDWTIRTSTYTTAGNTERNTHSSQIVAIRILSKIEGKSIETRNNRFVPIQICSLDEEGSVIIWSVLHNMGLIVDDLGLSYWGNIRLIKSQEVLLKLNSERKKINVAAFVDMHVDCINTNNLYIVTNTTSVLHATCIGNKTSPAVYDKYDTNPCGNVTCIEICPFERSFFLVGCDDGTVRLHALTIEKPILQLKDEHCTSKVKALQWSKSKPFTIYVLDNNSRIHIWDLNKSDVHPSSTVDMQQWGCISSMQLSSCRTQRDMAQQYLAFGMESGNVEIHKLKLSFHYSTKEDYLQELNTFMQHVAIL